MIIVMPTEDNNKLKFNHEEKSLKARFAIYADLECSLTKQQSYPNNPNESYTERKALHEPCGYSLDLVSSFDSKQKKHNFYRGKDCIKKFCRDLKELGTKIINYEEKDMIPSTDSENTFYEEQKEFHICQKDHCHYTRNFRGAGHSIYNLRYKVPQETSEFIMIQNMIIVS